MRREREEREETQESRPKKKRRRFGRFRFYFVNIFLGVVIALLAVCIFVYFCCRVADGGGGGGVHSTPSSRFRIMCWMGRTLTIRSTLWRIT